MSGAASDGPERTIIVAASNIARAKALELAGNPSASTDDRRAANAGLLASLNLDEFLRLLDYHDLPF